VVVFLPEAPTPPTAQRGTRRGLGESPRARDSSRSELGSVHCRPRCVPSGARTRRAHVLPRATRHVAATRSAGCLGGRAVCLRLGPRRSPAPPARPRDRRGEGSGDEARSRAPLFCLLSASGRSQQRRLRPRGVWVGLPPRHRRAELGYSVTRGVASVSPTAMDAAGPWTPRRARPCPLPGGGRPERYWARMIAQRPRWAPRVARRQRGRCSLGAPASAGSQPTSRRPDRSALSTPAIGRDGDRVRRVGSLLGYGRAGALCQAMYPRCPPLFRFDNGSKTRTVSLPSPSSDIRCPDESSDPLGPRLRQGRIVLGKSMASSCASRSATGTRSSGNAAIRRLRRDVHAVAGARR